MSAPLFEEDCVLSVWRLLQTGFDGAYRGLAAYPVYTMLSANDISRRYRRSRLGQLWLTISMATTVAGIGLLFSQIYQMPASTFIPYLAVGMIIWGFISQTLTEACNTFIENEGFMRQLSLSPFAYCIRIILRNIYVCAHNIAIIPVVFLFYAHPVDWSALLFIPGAIIVILNVAWMSWMLAIMSARFRDVPQIVQSVLQILFFVTPIIYKPTQLPADSWMVLLNPFAAMVSIVREPLLGQVPSMGAYLLASFVLVVGWLTALAFAGRYSKRLVYWL